MELAVVLLQAQGVVGEVVQRALGQTESMVQIIQVPQAEQAGMAPTEMVEEVEITA